MGKSPSYGVRGINQPEETLEPQMGSGDSDSGLGRFLVGRNKDLGAQVLQQMVAGACQLTGAQQGRIAVFDKSGQVQDLVTHGSTPLEAGVLDPSVHNPASRPPTQTVASSTQKDGEEHLPDSGMPPDPLLEGESSIATRIRYRGAEIGEFRLADKRRGAEFTAADEQVLEVFSSQAATAIVNSRRYRDEQRARVELEALIDTAPVGVVVLDAKTALPVSINQEARRIVSCLHPSDAMAEDLLGLMTLQGCDGQEICLEELPLAEVLSSTQMVRGEEITMKIPTGQSIAAFVNVTPTRSDSGEVESVIVTLQDMTPIQELERLRADFLGMVSRELRAPLISIKGSAAILRESQSTLDSAETEQLLGIMDSQANRMRDLIRDLLDAARIETGTLSVFPEPVEVANLVRDARRAFLKSGGAGEIVTEIDPDLPWVMADKSRMVQVLGKLLSNAAKYYDESAPIRVRATLDGFNVKVSVAEQGQGVRAQRLLELFRRYSRADGNDAGREVLGSGLHLAICKGIVEAHGGRVWTESEGPGMANWFNFTLALMESTEAATGGQSSSAPALGNKKQVRVLLVDPDPQTRMYMRDALYDAGFTPTVIRRPEQVVKRIRHTKPDVVVLDLVRPGVDGVAVMNSILAVVDVPVIFVSEYGRDEIITRALQRGAADYVVKPFSQTELVARIRAALRRQTLLDQAKSLRPFVLGDLAINYTERRVTISGRPVQLTATEYKLLCEFSINAGRVLTYDHLLRQVWGVEDNGAGGTVRTTVKRLRRKLGDKVKEPRYIFTVPRVGYRMNQANPPAPDTE